MNFALQKYQEIGLVATTNLENVENEGDCDSDFHCKAGLKCGKNNCKAVKSSFGGFKEIPKGFDCCYKPDLYKSGKVEF